MNVKEKEELKSVKPLEDVVTHMVLAWRQKQITENRNSI